MKIARAAPVLVALSAMACSTGGGSNGPCCNVPYQGGPALGNRCGCPSTPDAGVVTTVEPSGSSCTLVLTLMQNGNTTTATFSGGVLVASCNADGG